jgi:hypothetical protein
MQRIVITTSTSHHVNDEVDFCKPIQFVRAPRWVIEFEMEYMNAAGYRSITRRVTYEFTTRESPPFSLLEAGRLRHMMKDIGRTTHFSVRDTEPFEFEQGYAVELHDAGRVLEFFAGVFDFDDLGTLQEPQKQLSNGPQALPPADR